MAINQTVADLEEERGTEAVFTRLTCRSAHSGGRVFCEEALRTLAQAELAVDAQV